MARRCPEREYCRGLEPDACLSGDGRFGRRAYERCKHYWEIVSDEVRHEAVRRSIAEFFRCIRVAQRDAFYLQHPELNQVL